MKQAFNKEYIMSEKKRLEQLKIYEEIRRNQEIRQKKYKEYLLNQKLENDIKRIKNDELTLEEIIDLKRQEELGYSPNHVIALLLELYNHSFDLAMEDGLINYQEAVYLNSINRQFVNLNKHMDRHTLNKVKLQIRHLHHRHTEFVYHQTELKLDDLPENDYQAKKSKLRRELTREEQIYDKKRKSIYEPPKLRPSFY